MSEPTVPPHSTNLDDEEHSSVDFSSLGDSSPSATPVEGSATAAVRHDLVTFLATAQRSRVDLLPITLLPITFGPASDTVGHGGTAEILQAPVQLQSFAFKRVDPPTSNSSEDTVFKALVSEISVLGHPSMKTHPNIIALHGICWDVLPEGVVRPVLAFEKASMGNLKDFMRSDAGKSTNFADRFEICADISVGFRDMHASSQ